jgi:hypothetical protein
MFFGDSLYSFGVLKDINLIWFTITIW